MNTCRPFIAADIGNSRIKLGRFPRAEMRADGLGELDGVLQFTAAEWDEQAIQRWVAPADSPLRWLLCSVNRPSLQRLTDWLAAHRPGDVLTVLTAADLPLEVRVDRPEQVGLDRLMTALAANRLRPGDRPAIVIDLGSAITVDLISSQGAFLGGAILPGIAMSARALHERTDLLPEIAMAELDQPPDALGQETTAAMRSGLYWGAVGAMRELIARLSEQASAPPVVYLTGGAAPAVAQRLGKHTHYIPDMALHGVDVAAAGLADRD